MTKLEAKIAERFESSLDYIAALDKLPYSVKREMAEAAAREAVSYAERNDHLKKRR